MKTFRITHKFLSKAPPLEFSEDNAPEWLTSTKSIPGSTMDMRWFWNDHVLILPVGGTINTDFNTIARIS